MSLHLRINNNDINLYSAYKCNIDGTCHISSEHHAPSSVATTFSTGSDVGGVGGVGKEGASGY